MLVSNKEEDGRKKRSFSVRPSVLLVIAAFVFMIIASSMFMEDMLKKHIEKDAVTLLLGTKQKIESELKEPEMTLNVVAGSVREQLMNDADVDDILLYLQDFAFYMSNEERLLPLGGDSIYGMFDPFGSIYLSGTGKHPENDHVPEAQPWYIAAMEADGAVAVTAPYRSLHHNYDVITYSQRIFDDNGTPLGIVCVDLSVDRIRGHFAQISIVEGSYEMLYDEQFELLLRPETDIHKKIDVDFSSRLSAIEQELANEYSEDYVRYEGIGSYGVRAITFTSKLNNGWLLSLEIPKASYFHEMRNMTLGVSALGAVLAGVLIAILLRVISQRTRVNRRTQIMLDSMPLGVSFLDGTWTRIDCNRELFTMLGLSSKEEYLERYDEITPEYQPCGRLSREILHEKLGKTYYSGFERFEWTLKNLSGELMPCEMTLVSVRQKEDNSILMYIRDLRDLKTALDEKRETDEYMKLMLDAMPMGCSLWDKDFNLIDCNREAVKLYKVPDKQSFVEHFDRLSPEFQPCGRTSRELIREVLDSAFVKGYANFEWSHVTLDGEILPCEIILVRVKYKDDFIVAAYTFDMRTMNTAVEAMHKAEEDLRLALNLAEESAKAKGEFLDNMSHELRTPMNGIMGFLRMALSSSTPELREEHEQKAMKSAEDLLRIIDKVLDFTELEDSKLKINADHFNLKDVVNEVSNAFASQVKAKNLDFNLNVPDELDRVVVADSGKLKQVMTSLVDNACKFTNKGKITVRAQIKAQDEEHIDVDFYVRDTGIGMTVEQVQNLFTPFSQANMSATREYGGTGLELALCKHLVDLLGGKIWVESEYGEGSTFWFSVRFHLPEEQENTDDMQAASDDASGDEGTEGHTGMSEGNGEGTHADKAEGNGEGTHADKAAGNGEGTNADKAGGNGEGTNADKAGGNGEGTRADKAAGTHADKAAGTGKDAMTAAKEGAYAKTTPKGKMKTSEGWLPHMDTPTVLESGAMENQQVRILLAEDVEINQIIAEELLTSMGYVVDIANNGQEALDMLKSNTYQIVLMDLQMPVMDGLAAVRKIREMSVYNDLPIIAVTAHSLPADKEKSLVNGMNDHITKPLDPEVLSSTIEKWLGEPA